MKKEQIQKINQGLLDKTGVAIVVLDSGLFKTFLVLPGHLLAIINGFLLCHHRSSSELR